MSSKIDTWFKNLSKATKVSVISAVSAVALGGVFAASAITGTSVPTKTEMPTTQTEIKKAPEVTIKLETATEAIAFEKQTIESSSIAKGTTQLQTAGINGIKTITHTITLTDGVETSRTTSEANTSAPTTEVTIIGTYVKPVSNCDSNYSGCVPITSYDLDCGDIGVSVVVTGYDKHGFDRDGDGYGCESY